MKKGLVTFPRDEVIRTQYSVTYYMYRNVTHQIISPHTELLEVSFNTTQVGVRDYTLLSSLPQALPLPSLSTYRQGEEVGMD